MFKDITVGALRVLSALSTKEMYGYEIIKEIKEASGHQLLLGSLYNTLKSLERKGLVTSYWSDDPSAGGRRKYFKITASGSQVFSEEQMKLMSQWGAALS